MTHPMNDDDLSTLIREQATRFKAGSRLRTGIEARVAVDNARQRQGRWFQAAGLQAFSARWRHLSIGMVCGVLMTVAAGLLVQRLHLDEPSSHQLVAAHVQSMRTGPLYVVASSDRHTVKPWFQGKLDFAPPVPDLGAAGFALLGGRIEQLDGAAAAVLVYTHRGHIVTVFVRPGRPVQGDVAASDNGFRVLTWSDGAMKVSLVSDMDAAEVGAFRAAWAKAG